MAERALYIRRRPAASSTGVIERIPKWLNLVPMVVQWVWLGLRYRSFTLPSAANPAITAGGLVGDTKSEYFAAMGLHARSRVAPFALFTAAGTRSMPQALAAMADAGLAFPVVAKPDLGWCGFGVRRLDDDAALADYLASYPAGEALMLQRYLDEPGEAGLFYVRRPREPRGQLLGILLRHYPQVIGDGLHSVGELVAHDGMARQVLGDVMMVGAAAFWAATTLVIKASPLQKVASEKTMLYQLVVSAPMMAIAALLVGASVTHMPDAVALGGVVLASLHDLSFALDHRCRGQVRVKLGVRFSAKARGPSFASFVWKTAWPYSNS